MKKVFRFDWDIKTEMETGLKSGRVFQSFGPRY